MNDPRGSSRRLLLMMLLVVPSVLLVAFGWRMLQHKRELEQEADNRCEEAADLTAAETQAETAKFKGLMKEIQDIMTNGAKDCEEVEVTDDEGNPEMRAHRPVGIFHDGTPYPFEIGDPITRDRRVRAVSLEDAVEKWNDDEWLPPREPGTAEATHRDATGQVKSQKTVKVKRA